MMSKKLFFLISFVLVVGLNGTAQADAIEVNNPSFEYDINGAQIDDQLWIGQVGGWKYRNEIDWWPGADGWMFATVGENFPDFQASDSNVAFSSVPMDIEPNDTIQIYQILDPNLDANSVIAENYRYTLTFDAINPSQTLVSHDVNAALFYSTSYDVNSEANFIDDVTLASSRTPLPMTLGDWSNWEEVSLYYVALPGASSIGERLSFRLSIPAYPDWPSGFLFIDNVRIDYVLAVQAYDPYPDDEARDVAKNVTLGWKPGVKVQPTGSHMVYFGTDETAVENADTSDTTGIYQATRDVNNYAPGTLVLGETYYWRVDEVNDLEGGSPWKGDVWSFRATGYATNPSPYHGEVDVPFLDQSLIWTAGTEALSHDVYFGTDADAVADANTNSPEYKGNQAIGNTTYALTGLMVNEMHYWRIDELSAVHPSGLKGDVWIFTVGEFLLLDDFDSYASTNGAPPRLSAVWDDYWVNGSDGQIFLESSREEIRGGTKSMEFEFDNTSEGGSGGNKYWLGSWADVKGANLPELGIGTSDWTIGGVKALTLFFKGDPCNINCMTDLAGGPSVVWDWGAIWPWVELEDTSSNIGFVKYEDPNDMIRDGYHQWDINLGYFQDACGVGLSSLARFTIGVGGEHQVGQQATSLAKGYTYIDDIRLYPPRCFPELAQFAGNFNNDCIVNEVDLYVMASSWMVSDFNTVTTPPADPPEVWYRFDEGTGASTVENWGSWGSYYDITVGGGGVDAPSWTSDAAPALDPCNPNYAMDFDVNDALEIPNAPPDPNTFHGTQNMTITAWVKPEASMAEWDFPSIVESRTERGGDGMKATGFGFGKYGLLIYWWNNDYWDYPSGDFYPAQDVWSFTAVAVEPTQATLYYGDGSSIDSYTNIAPHTPCVDFNEPNYTNWIGVNSNNADPNLWFTFKGKIDDLRLYNKTLPVSEVAAISGALGEIYVPNTSVANIAPKTPPPTGHDPNDPDIVNFVDYEVMAVNWLTEILWPDW